jgi:hypothetical protein
MASPLMRFLVWRRRSKASATVRDGSAGPAPMLTHKAGARQRHLDHADDNNTGATDL